MKLTADKFKETYKGKFYQENFTNKHGEKFEIYMTQAGTTVYFAGDETEWEVLNLFMSDFSIWSAEELQELGASLMLMSDKVLGNISKLVEKEKYEEAQVTKTK